MKSLTRALILALPIITPATLKAVPTSGTVFLEDMTTNEVRDRLRVGCPVGIVFNGGFEETGPAVALGKHVFRARAYGEAIAREIGNGIVAPIQPFAPNEGDNGAPSPFDAFAGTISISPAVFATLNEQIARSLIRSGFRRVALFGDHGDGQVQLREVAAKLDAEYARTGVRVFFIGDGYRKARTQIEAEGIAAGRLAGGHGGLWDTAETLAVNPKAVRRDKLAAGDVSNGGNGELNANGVAGDPRPATVEMGKAFAGVRIKLATEQLRAALRDAGACRN
jgi:creatinine amidohydrolase/Fe(II)-dependent formamide hydrolase-like protein